jgi:nucleoid-associated protein YgaU
VRESVAPVAEPSPSAEPVAAPLPPTMPDLLMGPSATSGTATSRDTTVTFGREDSGNIVAPLPRPREITNSPSERVAVAASSATQGASATAGNAPPAATTAGSRSATPAPMYAIKEGETFSSIAEDLSRRHNTRITWVQIAQANPTVDPDRIRPGQMIRLPVPGSAPTTTAPVASSASTTTAEGRPIYTVKSGDTLSAIARHYYNDESKWYLIYEANRQTIGANPNRVREGMKLTIPAATRP